VVGTPAYMAPEQARGEPVDERADVYGLGALCYHVLSGELPYHGAGAVEVIARVIAGAPPPLVERQPRVPPDLAAIVAKAMARAPADRYPTAQELAADLRAYQAGRLVAAHRYSPWTRLRRWSRRHRGALTASIAAVAAAAAIAIAWPSGEIDPRAMCARAGERAAVLWTPEARAKLVERVRAGAGPGAATASGAIAARLDAYAGALRDARIDACEATRVRGEQSEELLDRRTACLDRRAADLAAAIGLFDRVAPGELDKLVRAVGRLPPLVRCARPESFAEERALPEEPAARAAAAARYERIAAGRAERNAGRYPRALEIARAVAGAPGETEIAPYAAEVHLLLGSVLQELRKHDEATPELHRALVLAELAHQDDVRAAALYRIARAAVEQSQLAEAERRVAELGALATRMNDLPGQVLQLELASQLAEDRGAYQDAIALERRSTELAERTGDTIVTADGWANLANLVLYSGRYAEVETYVRRAQDAYARTYGREHPDYARPQITLAWAYLNSGRAALAVPLLQQTIEVFQRAGLAEADDTLSVRATLAGALSMLGRHDDSEAMLTAVLAARGDNHPMAGTMMENLGVNRLLARQPDRAEPWLRRAVASSVARLGPAHPRTATARRSLAYALIERGDARGALSLLEAALPVMLKELGPDSDEVAFTRAGFARAYLELGQPARALAFGEEALKAHAMEGDIRERSDLRWVVARALAATGGDRARAIRLAEQARDDLAADHDPIGAARVARTLDALRR